uniref:siderophore-interacting protein n=1 Tax=Actinotalea sp. C106 TaxID=2908644 RepID=UPI00202907C3
MPSSSIHRITLDARLRRLTVRRVVDLSATMRRVELVGPDLEGFACHGPTDHAKVFFPVEPDGVPALPDLADGRFTDRFDPRYVCREYTVRTHRPEDGAMVLDLATHEHGPAGRWAAAAAPGRELGVYGPKTSKIPPMDRPWYLLAADEAGLPALTNWLERLAGRPGQVHALIEVDGPADEVPLPTRAGVEVTWVHRGGLE